MKHVTASLLLLALSTFAFGQQPSGQCLIVTSAEGHRFRNAMIAGVLTGGVGLAAGAAFGGGRYEYRDAFNLPAGDVKTKYKGPELQKLEQSGVHVIVVDKHDKTGAEVRDARASCQSLTAPVPAQAVPAPAGVPVSAPVSSPGNTSAAIPVQAKPALCMAIVTDAQGNETCTRYAQSPK